MHGAARGGVVWRPVALGLALGAALPAPGRADEPEAEAHSPGQRLAGAAAALVPGIVLHGAGLYALGERDTAYRLLALEGAGVTTAVAGAATFWLTGAARRFAGPATALTLAGSAVVGLTFLADLYGTLASGHPPGEAPEALPVISAELGYRYVHDPQFAYRSFAVARADVRWAALRASPSAWIALDAASTRLRLEVAERFLGPRPAASGRRTASGSHLELEEAVTRHAAPGAGVSTTGELRVGGRLDLADLGSPLRGAFAELGLGLGLAVTSLSAASDLEDVLLFRTAFGVYLGSRQSPRGELAVFYDHRHDDYAAGLLMPGIVSGVLGHFGLRAEVFLDERWGVMVELEGGAAIVSGASAQVRF